MKTSTQWWAEVKSDDAKIVDWLKKQYRGEITASFRIRKLSEQYVDKTSKEATILEKIAQQEETHAQWVKELLDSRSIAVDASDIKDAESRYWAKTLPGINSFETGAAVASHAEGMRLERIRAIANDEQAPEDIRTVFTKILKDEVWHESAFANLSTVEALKATEGDYKLGRKALGLEA